MDALRVYWRPGCSSCVKVKEFLTNLGVDFESINVSARPEAMEELRELGVRTVPVVARGKDYVFAQELADVSAFVGRKVDFERLPPRVLYDKWQKVLAAAQRPTRARACGCSSASASRPTASSPTLTMQACPCPQDYGSRTCCGFCSSG